MTPSESKRVDRRDFIITAIAIVFGLTVAGVSLMQVTVDDRPQLAQVMPSPTDQNKKSDPPAPLNPESSPKDPTSRPTTPPPQRIPPTRTAAGVLVDFGGRVRNHLYGRLYRQSGQPA